MTTVGLSREFPKIYPAILLSGGRFMLRCRIFSLPDSIKQTSRAFQERYVEILGSAAMAPLYRRLKDGETLARVQEICKTIPVGKIGYVFKAIECCGKLIVVICVTVVVKACL